MVIVCYLWWYIVYSDHRLSYIYFVHKLEIKAHLAVSHNGTPLGIFTLEAETTKLFRNCRYESPRNAAAHPRKRLETSTGPLRKPKNSHNCVWLEHWRSNFIRHWTTPVIVGWVADRTWKDNDKRNTWPPTFLIFLYARNLQVWRQAA
jgi:hypothetical protein